MCVWETFLFACGHVAVRLHSRCGRKRADDELDPCLGMQMVPGRLLHRMHGQACGRCREVVDGEGHGQGQSQGAVMMMMMEVDLEGVGWREVAVVAHRLAVGLAAKRGLE